MPEDETLLTVEQVAILLAATVLPVEDVIENHKIWNLPFNSVIPRAINSYFIYLKNTGANPVELTNLSISSSKAGSTTSYIKIHFVEGEPSFIRENTMLVTNTELGSVFKRPEVEAKSCSQATELTDLGQLDRFDLNEAFNTYNLTPNIILPPETAIAVSWGADLGALSGIVTLKEIE